MKTHFWRGHLQPNTQNLLQIVPVPRHTIYSIDPTPQFCFDTVVRLYEYHKRD